VHLPGGRQVPGRPGGCRRQRHRGVPNQQENPLLTVTDYSAVFRVRPGGAGASVVEWSADFEVTAEPASQAVDLIQGFLGAGLRNLEEQYG
jgi:hypothetical protein